MIEALTAGPRRVADLAQEMYRGAPAEVMPYAEKQVLAGLLKLRREGRAAETDEGRNPLWRLVTPSLGERPFGKLR